MENWTTPIAQPFSGQNIPRYLHGTIPPMATACNADHTLDERGIRAYTDFLIEIQKADTLFVRGGVSKMWSFSFEEVKQITDIVLDQTAGRRPVIVGCAGAWNSDLKNKPDPAVYTRQSIELSNHAKEKGTTASVLVLPSALDAAPGKSLEDTIVDYYRTVAANIDLPIVLYRPGGTSAPGYEITPSLLRKLLAVEKIVGIKISSGDMVMFGRLALVAEGTNFGFVAGDERAYLYTMFVGATGVIGRGCNTHPEILRAVYDRMLKRDFDGAQRAARDSVRALEPSNGIDSGLSSLLYAARKGVAVQPYTKSPAKPISDEQMDHMERALDEIRAAYLR